MALIKCSECGKEISSKAKSCPNCACHIEKKQNNNRNIKKLFIGILIFALALIIILWFSKNILKLNIFSSNNTENAKIVDTNNIKALCIFDAYTNDKETDGSTRIYLDGNSQGIDINIEETRERELKKYNCNTLEENIYNEYNTKATCYEHSKKASNGWDIYSYDIQYNYQEKKDINKEIDELKQQNYKCITYYNKNNSTINNNIIGSWCGYDKIVKIDTKYTFNEDGTGKYLGGQYIDEDFYYEIDKDNNIKFVQGILFLDMSYDENENIIYDYLNNKLSRCD